MDRRDYHLETKQIMILSKKPLYWYHSYETEKPAKDL